MSNYLEKVQAGIDFIENNIDSDISSAQVAAHAGLSQWHFQRIFKALTNETLKTYIRSRRMANALNQLISTDQRILDIALAAGYESQQAFTRAFTKSFDLSPTAYRKIANRNLFPKKLQINAEYINHLQHHLDLTPEIIEQKQMSLVGLKTCFYSVDSEKNNFADKIPPLWQAFLPRLPQIENSIGDTCYGVLRQTPEKIDELEYFAVIEAQDCNHIPADMVKLEIAPATYARFTHKGDVRKLDNTVNYIYSSWLIQSDKRHTFGADIESYGPDYDPCSDQSVIHYAIPIY